MSKVSRDRGNRHERDMARRLTAIVPEGEVVTTRNARGGAQGGNDLCWVLDDGTVRPDVLGWAVECKTGQSDPTSATWGAWLQQAERDAVFVGRPVVLWRRVGAHGGWVCERHRDGLRLVPLDQWLGQVAQEGER